MRVGLLTQAGVPVPDEAVRRMSSAEMEQLFGLPASIVRAVLGEEREPYTHQQVSVTELERDVRRSVLKRRYPYRENPMDKFWAVISTFGLHKRMEAHGDAEGEQEMKVQVTVDGIEVRARMDDYTDGIVSDWKLSSAWKGKDINVNGLAQAAPDDLAQVQMYLAMLRLKLAPTDKAPKGGRLVYVWRDWSTSASRKFSGYPERPIQVEELTEAQADFNLCHKILYTRVANWKDAMQLNDRELPECVDLWKKQKSGLHVRCESYCPVSEHCSQYQKAKA